MEIINMEECIDVLFELNYLTNKFEALKQENLRFLEDLHQISVEKVQPT